MYLLYKFNRVGVAPPSLRMTTPSSFALDVYMNDSTNPLEPTFDPLGT